MSNWKKLLLVSIGNVPPAEPNCNTNKIIDKPRPIVPKATFNTVTMLMEANEDKIATIYKRNKFVV